MTEKQGKFILKYIIDNSYPKLTKDEKETFKSAIDNTKNFDELFAVIGEVVALSNSR